jgi:hypothetical protein
MPSVAAVVSASVIVATLIRACRYDGCAEQENAGDRQACCKGRFRAHEFLLNVTVRDDQLCAAVIFA